MNHKKVSFHNRFGITLAADKYIPKEMSAISKASGRFTIIAVSGPFGAVREQLSGLDVQTICFDSSFTDESGGEPRNVVSPDLNTEVVETHSIS